MKWRREEKIFNETNKQTNQQTLIRAKKLTKNLQSRILRNENWLLFARLFIVCLCCQLIIQQKMTPRYWQDGGIGKGDTHLKNKQKTNKAFDKTQDNPLDVFKVGILLAKLTLVFTAVQPLLTRSDIWRPVCMTLTSWHMRRSVSHCLCGGGRKRKVKRVYLNAISKIPSELHNGEVWTVK